MNKTGWTLFALTAVIIIAAITLFVLPSRTQAPTNISPTTSADDTPAEQDPVGIPGTLKVNMYQGQEISSPLTVTGTVKGWYFEASFPVKLLDAQGKVIAQGPAQAQGDWMVDAFVPFKITLTYPAQLAGSKGTLVLSKDNPSGLPENDEFLYVPVVFK